MAHLEDFTPDQRDLLEALPYRVGLWVSASDHTGGGQADEAEALALEMIVTGFAEDFCKSEFVQAMMEDALSRRTEWAAWSNNVADIPGECMRAVDLLSEHLDRKEVTSFKLTLMEIATAVALAYREFEDDDNLSSRLKVYSRILREKIRALFTGQRARSADDFLNISEAEQKALDVLAQALDLGNSRGPTKTPHHSTAA